MQRLSRAVLPAFALAGCITDPEVLDEDPEVDSVDSVEQALEPGCSPPPSHYCLPHTVSATYPSPGFEWAPALYACWDRADIDLGIDCRLHGMCCGGLEPTPSNHSHDDSYWSNGVWHCTGTISFKYPCTAGSTNEECQPACL